MTFFMVTIIIIIIGGGFRGYEMGERQSLQKLNNSLQQCATITLIILCINCFITSEGTI